jgi:hypothetical protein
MGINLRKRTRKNMLARNTYAHFFNRNLKDDRPSIFRYV